MCLGLRFSCRCFFSRCQILPDCMWPPFYVSLPATVRPNSNNCLKWIPINLPHCCSCSIIYHVQCNFCRFFGDFSLQQWQRKQQFTEKKGEQPIHGPIGRESENDNESETQGNWVWVTQNEYGCHRFSSSPARAFHHSDCTETRLLQQCKWEPSERQQNSVNQQKRRRQYVNSENVRANESTQHTTTTMDFYKCSPLHFELVFAPTTAQRIDWMYWTEWVGTNEFDRLHGIKWICIAPAWYGPSWVCLLFNHRYELG